MKSNNVKTQGVLIPTEDCKVKVKLGYIVVRSSKAELEA